MHYSVYYGDVTSLFSLGQSQCVIWGWSPFRIQGFSSYFVFFVSMDIAESNEGPSKIDVVL